MHELSGSWILRVVGKQKGYIWSLLFELYTQVKGGSVYFVWSGHWWYEMCLESIHVLPYPPSYSNSELEWPDEWEATFITVKMKGINWKSWTQSQS